jgi:hypothetical protein
VYRERSLAHLQGWREGIHGGHRFFKTRVNHSNANTWNNIFIFAYGRISRVGKTGYCI